MRKARTSARPCKNSERLRQYQSSAYPLATCSGSREFHLSSTSRTFRIAVSLVKGGARFRIGFDCAFIFGLLFYLVDTPRFAPVGVRWLSPHIYAATADTWSGVSWAPPIGGIGLRYCFGCDTPSVIVFVIPARLPSLHSQLLPARVGPRGVPSPLPPWQPVECLQLILRGGRGCIL